jgi:hypothetical protein
MMAKIERDGLTFVQGQVSVDATSGINVSSGSIVEFETAGDATLTYIDDSTATYTVPNAGTRIGLLYSDVKLITFAGNISWS